MMDVLLYLHAHIYLAQALQTGIFLLLVSLLRQYYRHQRRTRVEVAGQHPVFEKVAGVLVWPLALTTVLLLLAFFLRLP